MSLVARFRTLKPETFADEKLVEISRECRLLFIGLWCFCDDMGRKAYEPRRIQAEVFPADQDVTIKIVDKWLRELERVDLIRLYKIDGKQYLWLPRFLRHQRIDKPSHSDLPPHPQDPDPDCQCVGCRIERGELDSKNHHVYSRLPKYRNVPGFTPRVVPDSSRTLGVVPEGSYWSGSSGVEINQSQNQIQHQHQEQNQPQNIPEQSPVTSPVDPPSDRRALDEISMRMLKLLQLKANPLLLEAVTKSIKRKARSRECTFEAAAQQISARAAFVATESPPEDWVQWFGDAGYEYVPEGDERLGNKRIDARPVCGSSRCQEGWETVKVGDVPVLRRCPDCLRLWQDRGL